MTIPWLMNCGHDDHGWCLDCTRQLGEERNRLLAALVRLDSAADVFTADQTGATHPLCGLTQPVTVAECEELVEAVRQARAAIAEATR